MNNEKKSILIELLKSGITRILIIVAFLYFQSAKAQDSNRFFTFNPITEVQFRNALKINYNAFFVTNIGDTTKLERALDSIDKTYSDTERELAKRELCNSARCLTSFKAFYPTLDLYLFYILDYHYEKACFVFDSTYEMASYKRFRGSHGVMSKDGIWIGLERQDCDNFLQIEICKTSKIGVWSLFRFDFSAIDINDNEKTVMFWADKNTVYLAARVRDHENSEEILKYYAIKFEY